MRNHLGTYECKLCLTLHNTEVRGAQVRAILSHVWLLNAVTSICFMLPSLHCVHCDWGCDWGCERVDSGDWTLRDANLLPTGACSPIFNSMDNTSLIHSVIHSDVSIIVIETYLSLFNFLIRLITQCIHQFFNHMPRCRVYQLYF